MNQQAIAINTPLRPWRPTLALSLSGFMHLLCVIAVCVYPQHWLPILGVLFANHLLLTIATLLPRSKLLGPNMTRLPESARHHNYVALTFDDGPDPVVTPQVLDILDKFQAKASFFCVANQASAQPELMREILRRGHSVENHSHDHAYTFALFGPRALRRDIEAAQTIIEKLTCVPPAFFRAPMGFRSPFLAPAVEQAGLRYVSWTRRGFDTVTQDADAVLCRLKRNLCGGDILLLHDGLLIGHNKNAPIILNVLPLLLEHLHNMNLQSVSLRTACNDELRV